MSGLRSRIGQRLREQREAMGLTRPMLAHRVGLSVRSLASIESGSTNTGLDTLEALTSELHLQVHIRAEQIIAVVDEIDALLSAKPEPERIRALDLLKVHFRALA